MSGNGRNSRETRRRLIESACRLFAEKGYRNASISDICLNADTNVASVNYHFGDKKGLFKQVWQHGCDAAIEEYPVCDSKDETNGPEAHVRSFISASVGRIFDCGAAGCFSRIMAREMAEPAGRPEGSQEHILFSERRALREVILRFLGSKGTERQADLCMLSIVGPCLLLILQDPLGRESFIDEKPDPENLEAMVDDFIRFVLAGMHAIKVSGENGKDEDFSLEE